ncbi:MAG: leucine-rich repeat domain-containing protein [Blautia marasmi]
MTSITIPASVTSIGSGVFQGCTSLTSVKLSEGLTRIGDQTFGRCNALETIEIPASLTSIGNDAFKNCAKLRSIAAMQIAARGSRCIVIQIQPYITVTEPYHSYKSHVIKMSGCTVRDLKKKSVILR